MRRRKERRAETELQTNREKVPKSEGETNFTTFLSQKKQENRKKKKPERVDREIGTVVKIVEIGVRENEP